MKHSTYIGIVAIAMSFASQAAYAQYTKLVDFDDIRVGPQYDLLGDHHFEGDTMFAIVRGIESTITPEWESQITRVDDYWGTPTPTVLVSNATWKTYTGADEADTILPGARMLVVDGQLQFLDRGIDGIYRVDTTTGALSTLVSIADIIAVTGETTARLIDAVAISPWNDMTFYDEESDSVLSVAPDGTLTTLITAADFQTLYGYMPVNAVAGGMTYDHQGVLYWTLDQTGSTGTAGGAIYKRDCDGTLSIVMAEINIWDITMTFGNVGFNDLYCGPDGNLYFYDRDSDSILYFDPTDPRLPWSPDVVMPNDLLYFYLTEAELVAGPMGHDYVGSFEAQGGDLTWNNSLTRTNPDVFNKALAGPAIATTDYDRDQAVDLFDVGIFYDDFTAPDVAYDPDASLVLPDCRGFLPADVDKDGDVDLRDLPLLQVQFTGS